MSMNCLLDYVSLLSNLEVYIRSEIQNLTSLTSSSDFLDSLCSLEHAHLHSSITLLIPDMTTDTYRSSLISVKFSRLSDVSHQNNIVRHDSNKFVSRINRLFRDHQLRKSDARSRRQIWNDTFKQSHVKQKAHHLREILTGHLTRRLANTKDSPNVFELQITAYTCETCMSLETCLITCCHGCFRSSLLGRNTDPNYENSVIFADYNVRNQISTRLFCPCVEYACTSSSSRFRDNVSKLSDAKTQSTLHLYLLWSISGMMSMTQTVPMTAPITMSSLSSCSAAGFTSPFSPSSHVAVCLLWLCNSFLGDVVILCRFATSYRFSQLRDT